jgi:hypothetical protein
MDREATMVEVLGIDNVLLDVGNLEVARGFYGGRLGLGVKFDFPEAGVVGFRLGDEEPGLLVRAGDVALGPPRPSPRLWLEVPDAVRPGPRWPPPGSRCSASRASCAPAGWWRSPTRGAT